jgi:hypothetical protein
VCPIISKNISIPGSYIIILYDVSSNVWCLAASINLIQRKLWRTHIKRLQSISEVFVGGLLAVSGFRPTHLAGSDKTTVGHTHTIVRELIFWYTFLWYHKRPPTNTSEMDKEETSKFWYWSGKTLGPLEDKKLSRAPCIVFKYTLIPISDRCVPSFLKILTLNRKRYRLSNTNPTIIMFIT